MRIDFSPLQSRTVSVEEFAAPYALSDLRNAVEFYLDTIRDYVKNLTDAQLTFVPVDPTANDTFASSTEEVDLAWTLAHLVLHVTASLEEGIAFSSLLARGIAAEGRLRYEATWRTVTANAQVTQRLDESRRMCLAYLDTWPDEPHLDVYRKFPAESRFANTKINAVGAALFGLSHLDSHLEQFQEVVRQATHQSATV